MFWVFGYKACGVLAPGPGIEPTRPVIGRLTAVPSGKALEVCFLQPPNTDFKHRHIYYPRFWCPQSDTGLTGLSSWHRQGCTALLKLQGTICLLDFPAPKAVSIPQLMASSTLRAETRVGILALHHPSLSFIPRPLLPLSPNFKYSCLGLTQIIEKIGWLATLIPPTVSTPSATLTVSEIPTWMSSGTSIIAFYS